MPSGFLRAQDRRELNNFPSIIEESDLITYFLLTPADHEQIAFSRTDTQRLGFALLLCGLRYLGFFPDDLQTAPAPMVIYLAEQLDCDSAVLADYGQRAQTRREHQHLLLDYLDFRWMSGDDQQDFFQWLSQRALENDRPSTLLQQASERLYKQQFVRPAITTLERLVIQARQKAHEMTYERLAAVLDTDLRARLDALLQPAAPHGHTPLSWLRRPARGYSASDILATLSKLAFAQEWSIDDWQLTTLPPARVHHLVQIARRSSNQAVQRKSPRQRYPLLMAFLADTRERLTDEVLDLYDHRIAQTERGARRDLEMHRLRLGEALQRTAWYLGKIAPVILDDELPDEAVRTKIFAAIPRQQFETLLSILAEQQRTLDKIHFFDTRYSYLRRFFPVLIRTLTFRAHQMPDTLLDAIHILRDLNETETKQPKILQDVPTDFVPNDWRSRVINRDGTITRRWYDLCVMWMLRQALRSGRIWVEHSRRYTHLETYLMPKTVWEQQRDVFFDLIPIPADSHVQLHLLQTQLEAAFDELDDQLPHDEALRLEQDRIVLTPFDAEATHTPLSDQIQQLMPHLQLAELLHEVDTWLDFSQHFEHAGGSTPRIEQFDRHLYAVMLAQARNIDFQQMVDVVDVSYRQLIWCNNWYIREETLQKATDELVNYQYRQPLSHYWGDGRFSSSDGQRFAVAVRTQNATPLPRYFGFGRGLTFLTWTSNQYSQYGTLVTPPTHGEATYTLDKILDNETALDIQAHTTDTAGYTDLVFALFDLLGIQFAPRIKDISDTRLYCIDPTLTYQHIDSVWARKLNLNLIHQNWSDMLRLAASLKFRWTIPSWIIRKLQAFPRQHILTQALQEYGRLVKTIFILRYFQSEAYRRRIVSQLNKGEKLHALRAHVHSSNRGRIRRKYPDDHLNQANCLNLITNAIIVWNTVYMQAAVQHLRQNGQVISEDEMSHLSPVRFEHINVYGKYSFDISVPLNSEGLRPLVAPI